VRATPLALRLAGAPADPEAAFDPTPVETTGRKPAGKTPLVKLRTQAFSDFGNFAESVCKWHVRRHGEPVRQVRSPKKSRPQHAPTAVNARPLRTNLRTRGEDPAHPRVCAVADDEGNAQLIAAR
jgi:hypothetical protein